MYISDKDLLVFQFLKKMLQIIPSLVLQLFCTSECLFPQKSPILGCLVYFRAKVFNDLFNIKKIKIHLFRHLQASYVYLFLLVSQA